ncbi:alpha/beta hydrolase fold domain-containing protein [Mariniflexile sp.]|uniref:alpha/beta hydrolase fold domain-containing protein n=1 Tax=Mariniflexile sp. TaxID=1979402 RepID=UPI0040484C18
MKNQIFLILLFLFLASCTEDAAPKINPPLTYLEKLDEPYGTDDLQKMDVYLPENRQVDITKVIMVIHGGGWSVGNKGDLNPLVKRLKAHWPGAAIVNINYRLALPNSNHHPTQINDIQKALQFLRSKKNEYQISNNFALVGHSAGAHLALLYTYHFNTDNDVKCVADMAGPAQIKDYEWNKTMAPVFTQFMGFPLNAENTTAYSEASPWYWIDSNTKPTIVFHGEIDVIVPIYQSNWLVGKLNENKVANQYKKYPWEGHDFNSTNLNDCALKMVSFFKEHM